MAGRTVKFGDDKKMKQKAGGSNINKFKAQVGVKDVIRLVDSAPYLIRSHYVEDLNRGFTCSKEWDEEKEAYVGACPLCEEGHRAQERFAVKVIHIIRGQEAVKKFRLWQFGLDKYHMLSDIGDESDKPLNELDLVVTCSDEKYQKLNIIPSSKCRKVTAAEDSDFDIDAVTAIPAYEKLQEQLNEARGTTSARSSEVDAEDIEDDEDLVDLDEAPKASGKSAGKSGKETAAATAAGADDDDDDYDISDLLADD